MFRVSFTLVVFRSITCGISEMYEILLKYYQILPMLQKLWKSGLSLCGVGIRVKLSLWLMIEEFGGACLRSELFYCLK